MGPLVVVVLGLLAIATVRLLADRIGVAAPLLLVLLGVGVALLPGVPVVEIEPEWILAGILPPLLFSSAVAMPAMEFRRAFGAVSGLSVLLVVLSAGAIGLLLTVLVPDLGLAGGIALGAILSPTDATATAIVRRTGVTSRVVTVLEGEGLLNDATALVLLRAAIAAGAASVSIGGVLGEFALAVVVAVVLGVVVGRLGLMARRRVADPTVNTVLSFATPFVASLPAEALGASGLVAAVAAGLVTGTARSAISPPQHRLSDKENWRTVELVLEGTIFLLMGLQLAGVLEELHRDGGSVGPGLGIAAVALVATVAVRSGYVSRPGRLAALERPPRGREAPDAERHERAARGGRAGDDPGRAGPSPARGVSRRSGTGCGSRSPTSTTSAPPRSGRARTVIVWAGMRGAVTLAAAQTLPRGLPRALAAGVRGVPRGDGVAAAAGRHARHGRAVGGARAGRGPDGAGAGGAGRAADRRRHRGARPVRRRPGRRGLPGTPGRPGRAPGPGALVRQTRPRPPGDDRGPARRAARRPRARARSPPRR